MLEQFIIVINYEDYKKWKGGNILARAIEDQEGNCIGNNLVSTMYYMEFTDDWSRAASENNELLEKVKHKGYRFLEEYRKTCEELLKNKDGQEDRYYKKRTKEISSLTITECELANGFWMTYDAFIAHMSSDASNIKNGLIELNSFYKHFDTEKDLIIFSGIYET